MNARQTFRGLEFDFRPKGAGRFAGAAFLGVWLTFWLVGEVFALAMLLGGAWFLVTGEPPGAGHAPLRPGPSLFAGAFLLVWLAFWSLGGWLAGSEFLKLLFGIDRLRFTAAGIELERIRGPFRSRQSLPGDRLRRAYLAGRAGALTVETESGTRELTALGDRDERAVAVARLQQEFRLAAEPAAEGHLPDDWREERAPTGERVLRANPATRRRLAQGVTVAFLVAAAAAAALVRETVADPSLLALTLMVLTAAIAVGWSAWRLHFTHDAWVLQDGALTLRRQTPRSADVRFTARALALREDADSDGDPWYRLVALGRPEDASRTPSERRATERAVWSRSGDPTEVRALGRWLAHRCRLPLLDRTTPDAAAEDLAVYRRRLEESGRFGRWAARTLIRPR